MTDLTLPVYNEVALHHEPQNQQETLKECSIEPKPQSIPIESVEGLNSIIPKSQKKRSGIYISQFSDYNITGYKVNEFTGDHSSRNHYFDRSKNCDIKYLIIHYSGGEFLGTLATFTNSQCEKGVGAHYIVTQKENSLPGGTLVSIVPEDKLAKHAGFGSWQDDKNLNDMSIGVVNINRGFIKDNRGMRWFSFDNEQIDTCGVLSAGIIERYGINPVRVLGHADVAPKRHVSPGPLFPWGKLYHQYGVGAWLDEEELNPDYIRENYKPEIHDPQEIDDVKFLQMLREYGYPVPQDIDVNYIHNKRQLIKLCEPVIKAFKAHFSANQHPNAYENPKITYNDKYWIWALTAKYKSYLK